MAAVEAVNPQTNGQPSEKPQPSKDGQPRHQQHAEHDAEHRSCNSTRSPEATVPARIAVAQNDYPDRYQYKRKQRADVREVGQGPDIENTGGNANYKTGNPGRGRWRAEARMHASEQFRQQPVAGHGKPHTRLAE